MPGAEPVVRICKIKVKVNIFYDIYSCDGVKLRTVSGWRHSSTKVTFTGVTVIKGENID